MPILPSPILSKAIPLVASTTARGMPASVFVTTWGQELPKAKHVIFYFGGMPTSSSEPALHSLQTSPIEDVYRSRDIHLVCIDKPGMGKTPLSYNFQILRDWPEMVQQVQRTLGIECYSVMGVSNGGPYVMATLTHEATKAHITSAAMIVGVSNVRASNYFSVWHPSGLLEGLYNSLPVFLTGPLTAAGLWCTSFYLSKLGGFRQLESTIPALRQPEVRLALTQVLQDGRRNVGMGAAIDCQQGLSPIYAQNAEQAVADYRKIETPVELWYGTKDGTVPMRTAEWLCATLSNARLHTRSTGHGLYLFHTEEVLDSICRQ